MACYFTAEDVATLNSAKDDAHTKFESLRNKLIARTYNSNRGREYAISGLIRRLDTMIRAIDYVYNILPPEQEDIPDADDRVGATIVIQSFVTNLHGCLDNLAWIWVYETSQRGPGGKELDRHLVGLGEGYWFLKKSFSKTFRKYLKTRRKWFRHVAEFRDSLAHRIPLYILPFVLSKDRSDEYHRLEKEAYEAGMKGDYKAYDELTSKQKALGVYRPWLMHSPTEKSPGVVFHEQLLQDFVTIDECANKILEELALFDKIPKVESSGIIRRLLCRGLQAIRDLIRPHAD